MCLVTQGWMATSQLLLVLVFSSLERSIALISPTFSLTRRRQAAIGFQRQRLLSRLAHDNENVDDHHRTADADPWNDFPFVKKIYPTDEALIDGEKLWERLPLVKQLMVYPYQPSSLERTIDSDLLVLSKETSNDETDGDNHSQAPITPAQTVARLSMCFFLSSVLVFLLETLTMEFEAIQAWRYMWPLVGIFYVVTPLMALSANTTTTSSLLGRSTVSLISIVAGTGLLLGGYMDAFFPVWCSSPDLLGTHTGLLSDSATILLLLTVHVAAAGAIIGTPSTSTNEKLSASRQVLVLAVLCAQLYEMGSYTFTAWAEYLLNIVIPTVIVG